MSGAAWTTRAEAPAGETDFRQRNTLFPSLARHSQGILPTFYLDPSSLEGLADLTEEDLLVLRLSPADTEAQHHHEILQEGL